VTALDGRWGVRGSSPTRGSRILARNALGDHVDVPRCATSDCALDGVLCASPCERPRALPYVDDVWHIVAPKRKSGPDARVHLFDRPREGQGVSRSRRRGRDRDFGQSRGCGRCRVAGGRIDATRHRGSLDQEDREGGKERSKRGHWHVACSPLRFAVNEPLRPYRPPRAAGDKAIPSGVRSLQCGPAELTHATRGRP